MKLRWSVVASFCWWSASTVLGCATLLGGLEEGTAPARDDAAADATSATNADVVDAGATNACSAPGWLEGFGHRLAFDVINDNDKPLVGFPMRFGFSSRPLIEAQQMLVDGRDIRVALGDRVVPHWIQSGLGGEATVVWSRVDLVPGKNVIQLYYGNAQAPPTSSVQDTFVDGVIVNGSFENGTAPWIATPPKEGSYSLAIDDRRAGINVSTDAGAELTAGWCQLVTFPGSSATDFRVIFDMSIRESDNAEPLLFMGGVTGTPVWIGAAGSGPQRGIIAGPIEAGTSGLLCASVRFPSSTHARSVSMEYSNVRVGVHAAIEPIAGPARAPESCASGVQRGREGSSP